MTSDMVEPSNFAVQRYTTKGWFSITTCLKFLVMTGNFNV